MKSKLIKIALSLVIIFGLGFLLINSTYAAADACSTLQANSPAWEAAGCGGSKDKLPSIITGILNAIIGISGLIAVIFVVVGGIQYMTSTGDTGKTQKAKNTILYALIGLVVCALAFAIVNWTIGAISGATAGKASDYNTKKTCIEAGFTWKDGKCQ